MSQPQNRLLPALALSLSIHLVFLDLLGSVPDLDAFSEMPRLNALLHRNTEIRTGGVPDRERNFPDKLPQGGTVLQRKTPERRVLAESFEPSVSPSVWPGTEDFSEPRFPDFRPMSGEELQAMARIELGKSLRSAGIPVNEITLVIRRDGAGFRMEAAGPDDGMLVEYTSSLLGNKPDIFPPELPFPLVLEFLSTPPSAASLKNEQ